jgi:hypothetical protein
MLFFFSYFFQERKFKSITGISFVVLRDLIYAL